MASRPLAHVTRFAVMGVVALAFAQPLAAQNPPQIIFRRDGGDGKVNVISGTSLALSDAAVRSLIETNLPDALFGDSARHVVLVVDANDRFVSGKVTNATVISANGEAGVGLQRVVIGDSVVTGAAANVIVIRRDGSEPVTVSGLPIGVSTFSVSGDGESADGVFGSGFKMADIASIGLRRYPAGQLGTGMLMVSVVKLK